jgi:2'-hydroxyisoflavone reductase
LTGSRRDFLKATALAAAATGLPAISAADIKQQSVAGQRPLDILILGGTGFIGPHMVREALRRGYSVTLFNRGRTNNALFPDLETIKGDRDNGLDGLEGRRWDAVIDNSGYVPRHVAHSARLLAPNCDRYVYISTVAVYADIPSATDEDSPLATMVDETIEQITGATYGPLKALCEKRAAEEFESDNLAILRPTYICGPGDRTDRFSYWPIRTRIDCVDREISGTYNMVNQPGAYTMGKLLEDCQAIAATEMDAVWVAEDFLKAQGLNPGAQLPIWQGGGNAFGVSAARAVAAGMQMRPERETARDLLAWWDTLPEERRANLKAGPPAEKEAEVLAAWTAR